MRSRCPSKSTSSNLKRLKFLRQTLRVFVESVLKLHFSKFHIFVATSSHFLDAFSEKDRVQCLRAKYSLSGDDASSAIMQTGPFLTTKLGLQLFLEHISFLRKNRHRNKLKKIAKLKLKISLCPRDTNGNLQIKRSLNADADNLHGSQNLM